MEKKYTGMSVNERLFESGLIEKFDAAVKTKNLTEVENLLKKIDLDTNSIIEIIKRLEKDNTY